MSMIGAIRCRATLCDDPEAYEEGGVNEMIKKCAINASSFHAINTLFKKMYVEKMGVTLRLVSLMFSFLEREIVEIEIIK